MYEAFFQMNKRPFSATPVADVYFPAKAIETARQTIARSIERATGPAVVLGPTGTGKSLLLAQLAKDFAGRFEIVSLAGGRLRTVRALLQNILFELKLPFRDLGEGELRLTLLDRLEPSDRSPNGLLLFVDEAHVLPSKLLDELRMITNLVRAGQPRVRLVLAGDIRLEERLANPRLASFQQRLAARCYLHAYAKDETAAFVRHQLQACAAKPANVVDDEALSALHRLTDGVPRLINQLCDHALILAAVASERRISASRMEEAWADLQQLPSPQAVIARSEHEAGSVIEFGALDDLPAPSDRVTRFDSPSRPRHDPLSQLDAIERHIAAANDDFDPLSLQSSELELTFESPAALFGEAFEEEEILIDRYASLEAQSLRNRPRVSSSEGRAIATLLGSASPARRQLGIVSAESQMDAPQDDVTAEAFEDPFDPALDPVMPEYLPSVTTNVAAGSHPELVVVDTVGDTHPTQATEPQGRVHRQEYRQLFARLRRGG